MKNPINNLIWEKYPKGAITQWFGENPALYSYMEMIGHNGIDIVAPYGTPIYAVSDQKIVTVKNDAGGYGRHIKAVGQNREYAYGHLSKIDVVLGQEVKEGDKIGEMGNSGFVVSGATPFWEYNPYAGTHLHFGIRELGEWYSGCQGIFYPTGDKFEMKNYNNGYKGSIDPRPFFTEILKDEEQIKALQMTVISLAKQVISLYQQLISNRIDKQ